MTLTAQPSRAPLALVTPDLTQRGRELFRRRLRHGLSASELSRLSGVDRKTIARAERGEASPVSAQELWEFFGRLDAEKGVDTSAPEDPHAEDVRFEVTGPHTEWRVTVSGPADMADLLRQQVVELLREVETED